MKAKSIWFSMALVICSAILGLYAIGALHTLGYEESLIAPVNDTMTNNATVIFNCTAASNTSEALYNITLWLAPPGGALALNKSNTTALAGANITQNASSLFTGFDLAEGLWLWNCRGNNGSGYVSSSSTNNVLVIDTTSPVIAHNTSSIGYVNDTYVNTNKTGDLFVAAVTVTELYPTNITYLITMANNTALILNSSSSITGASTYNLTILSIPFNISVHNGSIDVNSSTFSDTFAHASILININVTDNASNTEEIHRTVTMDAFDPVLSITSPFNGTTYKANATSLAIRFNLTRTDTNYETNDSASLYRLGLATGFSNTTFNNNSDTITLSMNATHQIGVNGTVIAIVTRDKAGRETLNYTTLNLDFAPVISLNYPAANLWMTTGSNILFNFTAINNDTDTSSLDSCTLYGNLHAGNGSYIANTTILPNNGSTGVNSTYNLFNGSISNITRTLVEGNYTWAVWCNDTTGNSVYTANRTLYVDLTNPTTSVSTAESTGASTISIGSTVTITCTATDSLDPSPTVSIDSVTKPSDTVVNSPGSSFSNTDQTGTYTVTCSSTDAAGYTNTNTGTFVVEYTSGSSGGSGGGGGGASTTRTQVVTVPSISPDNPAKISLSDSDDYSLKQIEISVKNAVSNVAITVKKLAGKPADASSDAASSSDKVYKYIEVLKENIEDSDITKASVTFQVAKSWLSDKGADREQIVLKRLDGGWDTMPTTITEEDDDNVYYKASTPGLSYFAVALEEKPATVTSEELAEAEEAMEAAASAEEMAPPERSWTWLWITLGVLVVLGAAAAIYWKMRK